MKVGLLQPLLHDVFASMAGCGTPAIAINPFVPAAEMFHGQVNQRVGRAAIPTQNIGASIGSLLRRNERDVGDSSQIEKCTPARGWAH